jgi:hypothetical protein
MVQQFKSGHALIVGVGADLSNTIDDAIGVADILKDSVRCAYPTSQVHLLTGEQATRDNILATLDALAKTTDDHSTVVIYFSGHGHRVTSTMGEAYYLMPYGYDLTQLFQTAISGLEFTDKLRAILAQKLLVLLDCCHAGGVGDAKVPGLELTKSPLPPEAHSLLAEGSGRVLIASSQEDELSYAGKPYSAFTLALIEALCGEGVAKKDGYVRVADLALHTRQVVPGRTKDRQHPILHFEHADNFVIAYYAGGESEPKGLPFSQEPEIEPEPGSWTGINQQGQTVQGPQTNIAGDVEGPVLSGSFGGPVSVGGGEAVDMRGAQGAVYKPSGPVKQQFGDISIVGDGNVIGDSSSSNVVKGDDALAKIFADLMKRTEQLPAEDQIIVRPIIEQARNQAEKLQQGNESLETQGFLEQRLRNLAAMAPDIGAVAITALANPSLGIALVIKKIAEKVQEEFDQK